MNYSNPGLSKKLLEDTLDLTKVAVYKNFFASDFLNEEMVKQAINNAIRCKAKENFTIWVNGNNQNTVANEIINTPLELDENMEEWTQRIFKNEKFCIFFTQAEQFNDEITASIGEFLHPILEKRGLTLGGCNLTILLGNYGFTPSGVHQDKDENCIFHFHLGPGSKEIFTWDPDDFQTLTGSLEPYHTPEKILTHAQAFPLGPNDFLVLPTKDYHIGRTDCFSIDLVSVLSDCTNVRFTQDVFKSLIQDCLARSKNIYKLDKTKIDADVSAVIADTYQHICMDEQNKSKSFAEVISTQIEDLYLTMLSNQGWNFPPRLNTQVPDNILDKKIQRVKPFKIYYKKKHHQMTIYIRGRELIAQYEPTIEAMIDKLNSTEPVSVKEFLKFFSLNEKKMGFLISFLKIIIEYKAIKIVDL